MITSLFSQKNICAALGFAMAITIVWKAKVETNLSRQTALIEYTEPTHTTGNEAFTEAQKEQDASIQWVSVSMK
jgi:hypothetical protein